MLIAPMLVSILIFVIFFFFHIKVVHFNKDIIKEAFLFCYPLISSAFFAVFITQFDRIIVDTINDNYEFALYNISTNISSYAGVIAIAILQSLEPDIFKLVSEKKKLPLVKIFIVFTTILLFILLLLSLVSYPIVEYLTAGLYLGADKYVIPMVMIKFLEQIIYFLGFILVALRMSKWIF